MNPILQTQEITKIYQNGADIPALKDVSLSIQKGESVAIVGKSGSGKSTLMHILATLDRPTSGQFFIDGVNALNLSAKDLDGLRNKKFGFVFQQFFLNGRNTVLENVTLPLVIMGVPVKERTRRGLQILLAVDLADKANAKANDLSGGQKQRLVIARSLITNPEVIFADEPTGNLDTENGKRITDLLFGLQKERGITLIIVTHDSDLAKLCDRTLFIKDGQIVGANT
jgi:putative ABC transport system ATP-binding protein